MLAFAWETFRELRTVSAVVIDHELALQPSKSVPACSIKPLVLPCWGIGRCRARWWWWFFWPKASIDVEVSVGGRERSMAPVSLHTPTLCCPVISIPESCINLHGLIFRKWKAKWFQVVEHSNWTSIHQESETVAHACVSQSFQSTNVVNRKRLKWETFKKINLKVNIVWYWIPIYNVDIGR